VTNGAQLGFVGSYRPYLVSLVRCAMVVLATPVLWLAWAIGQSCVDDPCEISRTNEWSGIAILVVFGALLIRAASHRVWPHRVALWLSVGVLGYVLNRERVSPAGGPIVSEAPAIASAGTFLVLGFAYIAAATVIVDWFVIRSAHANDGVATVKNADRNAR
jgi:hypothetical protein